MLNEKTVAVVIPSYNEETQIKKVLESMPGFVDLMVVVNDCSADATSAVVIDFMAIADGKPYQIIQKPEYKSTENEFEYADIVLEQMRIEEDRFFIPTKITEKVSSRVVLIDHLENGGVGAAIATGYKYCRDYGIDCTAVMAGDGQMDPAELLSICNPVIEGEVDYVKGNRLLHQAAWLVIPKVRFFGNSILSILTKIASGYWHISDTQTGYTAISLNALEGIQLHKIYKTYGVPNDILVKLNIGFFKIKEVAIKPVYNVGEKSKMKIWKVVPKVSALLIRSFFKRLFIKYFFRSFHPLFICYMMFFLTSILDIFLYGHLFYDFFIKHMVNENYLIVAVFTSLATIQFLLFGMWFDIQDNERLFVE